MGNIQDQNLVDAIARGSEITIRLSTDPGNLVTIGAWQLCEHPDKDIAMEFVNKLSRRAKTRIVDAQNEAAAAKAKAALPEYNHFVITMTDTFPSILRAGEAYHIDFASVGDCKIKEFEEEVFLAEFLTFRVESIVVRFENFFRAKIVINGLPGQSFASSQLSPGMMFIPFRKTNKK